MEEEREEGAECYHRGLKEAPVHRAPRDCDTGWSTQYKTLAVFSASTYLKTYRLSSFTVTSPQFIKYAFHLDF